MNKDPLKFEPDASSDETGLDKIFRLKRFYLFIALPTTSVYTCYSERQYSVKGVIMQVF